MIDIAKYTLKHLLISSHSEDNLYIWLDNKNGNLKYHYIIFDSKLYENRKVLSSTKICYIRFLFIEVFICVICILYDNEFLCYGHIIEWYNELSIE